MKHTQTLTEMQEEMAELVAKEIQREIDESLMLDILVEGGWTKVTFQLTPKILDWCKQNLKINEWKYLSGSFAFRKKKDAEWFILRWQ